MNIFLTHKKLVSLLTALLEHRQTVLLIDTKVGGTDALKARKPKRYFHILKKTSACRSDAFQQAVPSFQCEKFPRLTAQRDFRDIAHFGSTE